jgi:hypothetical protein
MGGGVDDNYYFGWGEGFWGRQAGLAWNGEQWRKSSEIWNLLWKNSPNTLRIPAFVSFLHITTILIIKDSPAHVH